MAFSKQLTSSVDNGKDADVIYLEFCKAFDRVPHYIISSKLERCGFSAWMRNWLNGRTQRIAVNVSMSKRKLVMSSISQGSILRLTVRNLFINNRDNGTEWTLWKLWMTLSCMVHSVHQREKMSSRHLDKDLDKRSWQISGVAARELHEVQPDSVRSCN